jgi:predicted dehydrogenase
MKISILGGGFGIYGYLPAACSLGWEVATLTRYSDAIKDRPELSSYYKSIQFIESERHLLGFGTAIVFAKKPQLQFEFLLDTLQSNSNLTHFYLEKPLADTISNSRSILDLLVGSGKSFSVGYLFKYTDWFKELEDICESHGNHIVINWRIPFTNSDWKNSQIAGGGLYNFFLIHFVPVLTRLGFPISDLNITNENQKCTIRGFTRNSIEINAQIVFENFSFELLANNKIEPIFHAETPFGFKPLKATPDPRIHSLKRYLTSTTTDPTLLKSILQTEHDAINFLLLCAETNNIK